MLKSLKESWRLIVRPGLRPRRRNSAALLSGNLVPGVVLLEQRVLPSGGTPELVVSENGVDFADGGVLDLDVPSPNGIHTVTLTNTGSTAMNLLGIKLGNMNISLGNNSIGGNGGYNVYLRSGDFALGIRGSTALPAGGSVLIDVFYLPPDANHDQALLQLQKNGQGETFDLVLSGNGPVVPTPEVAVVAGATNLVSGGNFAFGTTTPGNPISKTFTVQNVGTGPLTVQPVTVPAGYLVSSNLSVNQVIPVGGSATFTVQMTAASTGSRNGVIQFATDDADENPFAFSVQGAVVTPAPEVAVSVGGANVNDGGTTPFGTVNVGSPVTKVFTVSNTGTAPLVVQPVIAPAGFTVVNNLFANQQIAPGASATFSVKMDATVAGSKVGTLTFKTNDADESVFDIALTGVVKAPQAAVSVNNVAVSTGAMVSFGSAKRGATVTRTIMIRNTGTAPLVLQPPTFTGNLSLVSSFGGPLTLAPGAFTTIVVKLTIPKTGSPLGTFSIATNDPNQSVFSLTAVAGVSA